MNPPRLPHPARHRGGIAVGKRAVVRSGPVPVLYQDEGPAEDTRYAKKETNFVASLRETPWRVPLLPLAAKATIPRRQAKSPRGRFERDSGCRSNLCGDRPNAA